MIKTHIRQGVVGLFLLTLTSLACAGMIRHTISGTFTDNGTFGGYVDYDTVNDTLTEFLVNVSGGNLTNFPAFTYDSSLHPLTTSGAVASNTLYVLGALFGVPDRQLNVAFTDIGTLSAELIISPGNILEMNSAFQYRDVSQATTVSEVISSVPEPTPLILLLSGLAGIIGLRKKRK